MTYLIENYHICDYTVRIEWKAPSEQGVVKVSHYVVTITVPGVMTKTFYTIEPSFTSVVLYNYEHDVLITAENCNGAGETASISFSKGESVV